MHLRHVPGSRPLSKSSRPTRQLVLFAVSKGRSRLGGLAERAVEAGGELHRVAQHGDSVAVAVVGKSLDLTMGVKLRRCNDVKTCLMARMRPSIMSEGATISAPAWAKT